MKDNLNKDNITELNLLPISEFREKGYLQELNRKFLHPLGLAMAINTLDDGTEEILGIVDFRDVDGGVNYDLIDADIQRRIKFKEREAFINSERFSRAKKRFEQLGDLIEPIII